MLEDFIKSLNPDTSYQAGVFDESNRIVATDESLGFLKDKEWVLRFTETHYREDSTTSYTKRNYAVISNVSVLRLLFETDGVPYNLGVVDNKQTGSSEPDFIISPTLDVEDWLAEVLAWIVGCNLLAFFVFVILIFCPWIISLIGKCIAFVLKWIVKILLWILKGIWFVISFPFKLIGKLFKRK